MRIPPIVNYTRCVDEKQQLCHANGCTVHEKRWIGFDTFVLT